MRQADRQSEVCGVGVVRPWKGYQGGCPGQTPPHTHQTCPLSTWGLGPHPAGRSQGACSLGVGGRCLGWPRPPSEDRTVTHPATWSQSARAVSC